MAILQGTPSRTVQKIYNYHASKEEQSRPYLGGSQIGESCDRKLWYSFRWSFDINFSGQMKRLFETGHLAEPRLIKELRSIGITVYDFDAQGKQYGFSLIEDHFRGHIDAVIVGIQEAPKTPHLAEFKTHNQKSFTVLLKKGVQESKPIHYAQMQIYMGALELKRAFYLAVNKNTDELYQERIEFDKKMYEAILLKAKRIIYAATPPEKINENPAWYECKLCDFSKICHSGFTVNKNCRTCIYSKPGESGQWFCSDSSKGMDIDAQRKGCDHYTVIPELDTIPF